jgi:transposase-like protein
MSRPQRRFSSEFKQEAMALVRRSGQSANQVAKELGIGQTSLSRWLRQAAGASHKANGFQTTEEVTTLRREVERLRMERDILKKAAAFFAKESA